MATDISDLYVEQQPGKWPIVYHKSYNISFAGLQRLHPFDSGKWGRIVDFLVADNLLQYSQITEPREACEPDLLRVHTRQYLRSLKCSFNVAKVTEVPPVALLPNPLVQWRVLKPFRLQTGGTVLAARLALLHGWAINIGGGFHHCCAAKGGGFCAYADITLAIRMLQAGCAGPRCAIRTAMIVDLDAHQGNGHERDFGGDGSVFILDAFNCRIYPRDKLAEGAISRAVLLFPGESDAEYLPKVATALQESLDAFKPDLVVFNAGTDIMRGDPLGLMHISEQGVISRDEIVFEACRSRQLPVVMVTSGGYQRSNARVIANSIINLKAKGLIREPDGGASSG